MAQQQDRDQARFAGWHRQGRQFPWRQVVTGPTEYETLGRLLEFGLGGDLTVLIAGRDPNQDSLLR